MPMLSRLAHEWRANTSEATEGEGMLRSKRLAGKLATAAVVAGLIVGPASADAKTIYPYAQATSSSQGGRDRAQDPLGVSACVSERDGRPWDRAAPEARRLARCN